MRFVVLVHNQSNQLEKTISSIKEQTLLPDKTIVIEDGVISSIDQGGLEYRSSVRSLGLLYHVYTTVHQLEDSDVVMVVNGGDALAHAWVIERLHDLFHRERALVAYGGMLLHPTYERVFVEKYNVIDLIRKEIRKKPFAFNQFTVFYAGLFKKIALRDLLYQGQFFVKSPLMAYTIPLLEMAEERAIYLEDAHYIRHGPEMAGDLKEIQLIQSYTPYSPVDNFVTNC